MAQRRQMRMQTTPKWSLRLLRMASRSRRLAALHVMEMRLDPPRLRSPLVPLLLLLPLHHRPSPPLLLPLLPLPPQHLLLPVARDPCAICWTRCLPSAPRCPPLLKWPPQSPPRRARAAVCLSINHLCGPERPALRRSLFRRCLLQHPRQQEMQPPHPLPPRPSRPRAASVALLPTPHCGRSKAQPAVS